MAVQVHRHEHKENSGSKRALSLAIGATAGILVVELAGGLWTNSLALLSDAAHVFMDLLSFILTLWAIYLAERSASDRRTFGWHRIEVFAALINALSVFVMAVFIFLSAIRRIRTPEAVLGPQMLVLAVFGLIVNGFVIWKLKPHSGEDLNVRSAFLHAVGDALASVAVVASGVLILATKKMAFDPAAAILVSLIILVSAYRIFGESMQILLEEMPKGLDRDEIVGEIEGIAGPHSVKDLHVWNLCSHLCALSVHLVLPEERMRGQRQILENVHANLEEKFNIVHSTIQIESATWQEQHSGERRKDHA